MKRILFFIAKVLCILTVLSLFSCSNLFPDLEETLDENVTSEYTFFEESPEENASANKVVIRVPISSTRTAATLFDEERLPEFSMSKAGYEVAGWKYYKNPLDNNTVAPGNMSINSSGYVSYVTVSPDPAYFVADWKVAYQVYHYVQDLEKTGSAYGYTLYKEEKLYGTNGAASAAIALDIAGYEESATNATQQITLVAGASDNIVKVYYDRKTITYTFNENFGTSSGDKGTESVSGRYGEAVPVETIVVPARYDKDFKGWYPSLPSVFGSEDKEFTALWDDTETYTLTFDSNCTDSSGQMAIRSDKTGTTFNLAPVGFTRTGYSFKGWATSGTSTTVEYTNQGSFTVGTSDVTLYAIWEPISYKVKFVANGGVGADKEQTMTYDTEEALEENTFTKEGYDFAFWTETATKYSDKEVVKNLCTTSGDTKTLYAAWKAKTYTIKFDENGGTGTRSSLEIKYNAPAGTTLSSNEYSRNGYAFKNWNTSSDGTGIAYEAGATVKVGDSGTLSVPSSGDEITLYAIWEATGTFTVTVDTTNSDTDLALTSVTSGSVITFSCTGGFSTYDWTQTVGDTATTVTSAANNSTCVLDVSSYTEGTSITVMVMATKGSSILSATAVIRVGG